MTSYVIDASVAIKWIAPEEGSAQALQLRDHLLAAPDLLLLEAGNAIWRRVLRGEASNGDAEDAMTELHAAPVQWFPSGELASEALSLATALDHPIYDCVYLALVLRLGWPLITADARFRSALAPHPDLAKRTILLATLS